MLNKYKYKFKKKIKSNQATKFNGEKKISSPHNYNLHTSFILFQLGSST
jgi:hypothetical protein